MIVAHALLFVHWPSLDTVKLVAETILAAGAVIALLGNIFTRVVVAWFRHIERRAQAKYGPLIRWQGGFWKVIFPFAWARFEKEQRSEERPWHDR